MSLIELSCTCGRQFRVSPATLGRAGRCPACQRCLKLIAPGFRPDQDRFDSRLVVEAGPHHRDEQILLSGPGPIEIGKLPDRHIHLDGQQLSRLHCRLVRSKDGWRVADCKSTNGTLVNNDRVDGAELYDGDELTVGEYVLRFRGRVRSAKPPSTAALPPIPAPAASDQGLLSDDLYALSEGEEVETQPAPSTSESSQPASAPAPTTGGPTCPACERSLAPNAKICVFCGINLQTGRAILTTDERSIDSVYGKAEKIIPWLSWLIPFGIFPIASEALGTRKPFAVYGIAILTIIATLWFWSYEWNDSPKMVSLKNYWLWTGTAEPDPETVYYGYTETVYGDREAFEDKLAQLSRHAAATKAKTKAKHAKVEQEEGEEREEETFGEYDATGKMVLAANESLPPDRRCLGQFHGYQLITNAFLHGGIMHLVGNLFFLWFFGTRVNALIGNVATLLLYPILAVFASLAMLISETGAEPAPCLGASGAIMGLAGLYLALMPVHKIHMAFWWRWGLVAGFRLSLKLFAIRGFWVVLFYIKWDILFTILKVHTGIGHWAHLGGLLAGLGLGIALLMTRLIGARGGDIVSALFGRWAWGVVGVPNPEKKPLLQRLP